MMRGDVLDANNTARGGPWQAQAVEIVMTSEISALEQQQQQQQQKSATRVR
jgi:hypothetical protein